MKSHFQMQDRPMSLNQALAMRANELARAAERVKHHRSLTEAARVALAARMAPETPTGHSTAA